MLDVVVIGAGITGLRAARALSQAGLAVHVLEARERVGGRLASVGQLDLGATWFWPNEPRVQQLVAELGLRTHRQHLAGDALYDDPRGRRRIAGNPLDGPAARFSGGAAELALGLADRFGAARIALGSPVDELRVDADGVTAVTGRQAVVARRAVVAVPPALAVERIRFAPALPDPLAALLRRTPVWMGGIAKVVVRYPAPFWRDAGLAGAAISHVGPLREIHDMSGPNGDPAALFGFASSPLTPPGTIDEVAVVAQLIRLFGSGASSPEAVHVQDWRTEAWTTPATPPEPPEYELYGDARLRAPVHDRIHFASTETAPAFAGHIEGALLAADLVADEVRRRLRDVGS